MSRLGSCRVSAAHSRSIWLNQLTSAMASRFLVEIAANDTPYDSGLAAAIEQVESEYADDVHVLVDDASGAPVWVKRITIVTLPSRLCLGARAKCSVCNYPRRTTK